MFPLWSGKPEELSTLELSYEYFLDFPRKGRKLRQLFADPNLTDRDVQCAELGKDQRAMILEDNFEVTVAFSRSRGRHLQLIPQVQAAEELLGMAEYPGTR